MTTTASISIQELGKCYVVPRRRAAAGLSARVADHFRAFTIGLGNATEDERFWALRDITYDVMPGDVVGILGKNGSGKSTMLKILSGVTVPTAGTALLRGRVGSLLEVGTGFHPDLSGRENVFMSGALLGMSRADITRKLDAIIAFAGIDDFIDLPVKRYSSGMYVRLAYAVASHLDTDVLILDEVLAVGDAEFRKKSIANMEEVAQNGRTILFVSHSASSVASLCTRGMVLSGGRNVFQGTAQEAVSRYLQMIQHVEFGDLDADSSPFVDLKDKPGFDGKRPGTLTNVETLRGDGTPTRTFSTGEEMRIRIGYELDYEPGVYFTVFFLDPNGDRILTVYSNHEEGQLNLRGKGMIECVVPELRLGNGDFSIMIDFGRANGDLLHSIDCVPNATTIRINLDGYLKGPGLRPGQGYMAQRTVWRPVEV
jgi:lipopolysaccharide transport system ATP-binding protein